MELLTTQSSFKIRNNNWKRPELCLSDGETWCARRSTDSVYLPLLEEEEKEWQEGCLSSPRSSDPSNHKGLF